MGFSLDPHCQIFTLFFYVQAEELGIGREGEVLE